MKVITHLRQRTEAAILRLNKQREAIDAQLRPLLAVMRVLDEPSKINHRKAPAVAHRTLTRAQRTAMVPNLLQRSEGVTAQALAEKLGVHMTSARARLEQEVKAGRATRSRSGRSVVYRSKR